MIRNGIEQQVEAEMRFQKDYKWEQCRKTLVEKRPDLFGDYIFPDIIKMEDIDYWAYQLGKRIYVYPRIGEYNVPNAIQYLGVDIWDNQQNIIEHQIDTDQTEKLPATQEGLMSIVEKL